MKLEKENHSPPRATKSFKSRAQFLLKFLFPKNVFLSLFSGLIWAGLFSFVLYAFATPPTTPYDIGETLNPTCSPSDTNCSVVLPAAYSFSSNAFSGTGNFATTGTIQAGSFTDGTLTITGGNITTTGSGQFGSISFTTALGVGSGGTGLGSIAIGSILAANSLNTLSAVTSTSGLTALQNNAGVISWNPTTGTGNSVFATSPTITTPTIASLIGNKIYPASDSTTAIQINKADGTTNVLNIDTTNRRVGIGETPNTSLTHILQLTGNGTNLRYGMVLRDSGTSIPSYSSVWDATTMDTNTVGTLSTVSTGSGGLHFGGFTANLASATPLMFSGISGSTAPTVPAIVFRAGKTNGVTGVATLASSEMAVEFRNWTTSLISILGSGYVGIGTTSPGAKLEVLNDDIRITRNTSDANTEYGGIKFGNTLGFASSWWAGIRPYQTSGYDRNGLYFYTSNITAAAIAMTIQPAGNVGIGTTTPTAKLAVGTSAYTGFSGLGLSIGTAYGDPTTNLAYGNLYIFTTDSEAANKGGTISLGGMYTGTTDTRFAAIKGAKETITDGEYGGYLAFYSRTHGATGPAERMRINSAGNVGIGTTSPTAVLHLKAGTATASTAPLKFTAGTLLGIAEAGTIEYVTDKFVLQSDGLYIAKNLEISTNGSTTLSPRTGAFTDLSSGEAARFQFGDSTNAFQLTHGGTLQMYSYWGLQLSGSRQTTAPSFVAGAASDPSVTVLGTVAANKVLVVKAAASQSGNILEWQNSSGTGLGAIDASGNVGIGTITPSAALDVNGNIVASASGASLKVGATYKLMFSGDTAASGELAQGVFGGSSTGGFSIAAGGTTPGTNKLGGYYYNATSWLSAWEISNVASGYGNLLLMKSGGKVGIGTSSPTSKLTVIDSIYPTSVASFQNTYTGAGALTLAEYLAPNMSNQSAGFAFGKSASTNNRASLSFVHVADGSASNRLAVSFYGGLEVFSVLGSGNVGIGTTSPSAFLHVLGTTEQLRVAYDSTYYSKFTQSAAGLTLTPSVDSTTAYNFTNAAGDSVLAVDTTSRKAVAYAMTIGAGGQATITSAGYFQTGWGAVGTPAYSFSAATNYGLYYASAGVRVAAAGAEVATFKSGGNVGIGVTSPTAVLNLKAGTSTASTAPLKFTAGTKLGTPEAGAIDYESGNFILQADTLTATGLISPYIAPSADSTTAFQIRKADKTTSVLSVDTTNSKVGIGTTTLNAKTEISRAAADVATSGSGATTTAFLRLQNSTGGLVGDMGIQSTSPYGVYIQATNRDYLNSTYPLLLNPVGGNVGIGNTAPQTKFVVGPGFSSAINGTPIAYITDNTDAISGLDMGNLSTGTAADFRFTIRDTSGHYFAFIQPGVNNSAASILGHARNTADFIFNSSGTARDLVIGNLSAKDLILGTNNTERIRVLSGGNVGIGVTSPSAVLHLKAGTSTAGTAPLKFTAGTLLSVAEAGTIEYSTGLFTMQSDSLTVGGTLTATTLATGVESTSPSGACTDGSIKISSSGTTPGIYYCYGGAWHYSDQTGGFQIPKYESVDPITGEQMQVGDFVVPMVDKVYEDGTAHGVWARWSTVKAQLLAEVGASTTSTWSGAVAAGTVSGVDTTTLTEKVTNVLSSLGITISNGVTSITKLTTTNLTASVARVNKMEMVASNGDIYCTWIGDNGEWQKVKGECSSVEVATAVQTTATTPTITTTTTTTAAEVATTTTETTTAAAESATQALEAAQQAAQAAAAAEAAAQSAQQSATEAASTTSQTTTTVTTAQLNIVSISSIQDINVEYGSTPTLPETIAVTLSDGITANPSVSWDSGTPTFDANTAGTYVFTGTPTTTSSITNTDNLTATVNVIVAPQPTVEVTPTTEESAAAAVEAAPSVGELIQESTSSLINGMWKFIQWIFGSTAQQVSKLVPADVKQSTAGLSSSATDNFKAGLNQIYSDISGMIKGILKIPNTNVQ